MDWVHLPPSQSLLTKTNFPLSVDQQGGEMGKKKIINHLETACGSCVQRSKNSDWLQQVITHLLLSLPSTD